MGNASDYMKQKIRTLMEAQHYTIYSLAKAADLTQTCIANWYSSRNYEPSFSALEKVCRVFGISLAEFFCSEDEAMVPADAELKALFDNWQKLNLVQKEAIKAHIKGYLQ